MKEVECYNCDGLGWSIIYGWHGLPEQDRCGVCNGEKKMLMSEKEYNDAIAHGLLLKLTDSADRDKYQVRW